VYLPQVRLRGVAPDAGRRTPDAGTCGGFGQTTLPSEVDDYRMRMLVSDVAGLLDALGVGQATVVGHDWGAALSWAVAMTDPERVSRLVTVSVGHPGAVGAAGIPQRRVSWYVLWFLLPGVAEQVLPAEDWAYLRQWGWDGVPPGMDADADRQIADLSRPGA
jgi:pimeloyl-ACP methyl ester carboxylesterase